MRGRAVLAIVAFLTGCGGGGPAPLPTSQISAYFPAGGVADTIEVDAIDRLAMRRAELVAPDGRTTAAISIVARPAPIESAALALPTGAYAGGASALAALAPNPPTAGMVGAAVQRQGQLFAIVSSANIALPDPVAYRRAWQKYRIRLGFGDRPNAESREIAAPEPPPAASGPSPASAPG
jgi:predicted small lipoprotein YifL